MPASRRRSKASPPNATSIGARSAICCIESRGDAPVLRRVLVVRSEVDRRERDVSVGGEASGVVERRVDVRDTREDGDVAHEQIGWLPRSRTSGDRSRTGRPRWPTRRPERAGGRSRGRTRLGRRCRRGGRSYSSFGWTLPATTVSAIAATSQRTKVRRRCAAQAWAIRSTMPSTMKEPAPSSHPARWRLIGGGSPRAGRHNPRDGRDDSTRTAR